MPSPSSSTGTPTSTPTPATLALPRKAPTSTTTTTTTLSQAYAHTTTASLTATIWSAYDLPVREPPTGIQLTLLSSSHAATATRTLTTGPPVQRHKNKNSFKFASSDLLTLTTPTLRELYQDTLQLKVLYEDAVTTSAGASAASLTASLDLKELVVNQPTWLIIPLKKGPTTATTSASAASPEDSQSQRQPSVRLRLTLRGPYRPEIALVIGLAQQWFAVVDRVEAYVKHKVPSLPSQNYLLLLLAASPLILVSLPVLLPLLLVLVVIAAIGILGWALLWASTKSGRAQLSAWWHPSWTRFSHSPTGQRLLYQTGPRPSPVEITRALLLPQNMWTKLAVSLTIDTIGNASYLLPVVGELADVSWAPLQTLLIMAYYDASSPNLKYLSFLEELLPLTDCVPSATLGWLMEFGLPHLPAGVFGSTCGASKEEKTWNKQQQPRVNAAVATTRTMAAMQ
jgi:hypothetical protein